MGGFLESLGRTNALSNASNTIFQNAVNLRKQQEDEKQTAFTNAINMEKLGMEREEFGIKKDAADREATKFGWAAEEQAKIQKFNKSVVPIDSVLQGARPGTREELLKLGKQNGWIKDVGGNLVISNEDMKNAAKYLNENLDVKSKIALVDIGDINKEMEPLKTQLAELKATKPDDKQIPILQERIAVLDKTKTTLLNSVMELDAEFQKKKALQEEKDAATEKRFELAERRQTEVERANAAREEAANRRMDAVEKRGASATAKSDNASASVGKTNQVNRALVRRYLPIAKKNLEGNAEAPKILEGINLSLGSTDQFGGSVNDARLYDSLSPSQRDGYDWVKAKAEEYSRTMSPEAAVEKAWKEGMKHPASGAKAGTGPAGYAATGKMHNGKPLYHNPKAPKGQEYWTP